VLRSTSQEQIVDICRKSKELREKKANARSQKTSGRGKIKRWDNLFRTRKQVAKAREEMNKYRRNVDEMAHGEYTTSLAWTMLTNTATDTNNPVVLELYTQLILLQHDAGKDYAVFENPDHTAQGVLHALARKLGFEYEYSLLKMQVTISKPISTN
jgi:hypothetical protein